MTPDLHSRLMLIGYQGSKSQVDELDDLAPKRTLRLQTRVVEANTKISYIARTVSPDVS